jgi:predicted RND superfamily exporter protein
MFLTIIVIIWLLLKTAVGTYSTVVVIASSIATTIGVAGWSGMFISTATVNVPTMVMTLAVADCIHVISTMSYEMRQGRDKSKRLSTVFYLIKFLFSSPVSLQVLAF